MKTPASSSRKKTAARAATPSATTSKAIDSSPTNTGCVFRFKAPDAKSVSISGAFNGWMLQPLAAETAGSWMAILPIEPGRYEYLFVVDGQWVPDPSATETVYNPYGGVNSVLIVPPISTS